VASRAEDAKRLKYLERENGNAQAALVEAELKKAALKDRPGNFSARMPASRRASPHAVDAG
jgi:hypothetical protein